MFPLPKTWLEPIQKKQIFIDIKCFAKRHGIAHSKLSFLSFTSFQHQSQNDSLDLELENNQQKAARLDRNSQHCTLLYMAPQSFKRLSILGFRTFMSTSFSSTKPTRKSICKITNQEKFSHLAENLFSQHSMPRNYDSWHGNISTNCLIKL